MHSDLAEVDLPEQGFRVQLRTWRALLDRPLTSYYLVLGITLLLLGLGLVMVQSTASVADLTAGLSPYSDFKKQLLGACVGLPLMWVAARSSPRLFRALAYPLLAVSVVGLCLTLIHGVGVTQNGASRWINIGGQQVQPSEIAKLALAMWGADLLARKDRFGQLADWRHMLVPLMPGAGVLWGHRHPRAGLQRRADPDGPGHAPDDRLGQVPLPAPDRLPAGAGQCHRP